MITLEKKLQLIQLVGEMQLTLEKIKVVNEGIKPHKLDGINNDRLSDEISKTATQLVMLNHSVTLLKQ